MIEDVESKIRHEQLRYFERFNQLDMGSVELQVAVYESFICLALVDWETGDNRGHVDFPIE